MKPISEVFYKIQDIALLPDGVVIGMVRRSGNSLYGSGIRWALLLWILIVCLNGVIVAQASALVTFSLGDAQSPEPGTLRIPILIENAKDYGAIAIDVELLTEPDFLTLVSCDQGELTPGSLLDCNYGFYEPYYVQHGSAWVKDTSKNYYKTNISLATTSGITGSGILTYVNFKYDPSFEGVKEVHASINWARMYTLDNKIEVPHDTGDIIVYYIGASGASTMGDLSGDGKVTAVDALMALQMTIGKIPKNEAADMDKDGRVLVNDALLILQKASLGGASVSGGGHAGGVMTGPPASEAVAQAFRAGMRG
jgi:Dockerin type I domain